VTSSPTQAPTDAFGKSSPAVPVERARAGHKAERPEPERGLRSRAAAAPREACGPHDLVRHPRAAQQVFRYAPLVVAFASEYARKAREHAQATGLPPAPWLVRHDRALERAGRVLKSALTKSAGVLEGKNPLGIEEADLPLYFLSESADPGRRFSAISDYLRGDPGPASGGWATSLVRQAQGALDGARTAWAAQFNRELQTKLTNQAQLYRAFDSAASYGDPILQLCGPIAGLDKYTVIDNADRINPATCWMRSNLPECQARPNEYARLLSGDDVAFQFCVARRVLQKATLVNTNVGFEDASLNRFASSVDCKPPFTWLPDGCNLGGGVPCFRCGTGPAGAVIDVAVRPGALTFRMGGVATADVDEALQVCRGAIPFAVSRLPSPLPASGPSVDKGKCYKGSLGEGGRCACAPKPAEACNGSDDDCDGVVDGEPSNAACVLSTQSPTSACCGVGACVETATSSESCGACGRSCRGGTCIAGRCQPTVVSAEVERFSSVLTVAGGRVYFSASRSCQAGGARQVLLRCAPEACATPELVHELACGAVDFQAPRFSAVAVDPASADRIVFATAQSFNGTAGSIFVRDGTTTKPLFARREGDGTRVDAIAIDAASRTVFFGDGTGAVYACPISGCTSTVPFFKSPDPVTALTLDEANVYFATRPVGDEIGSVRRCEKAGCAGAATTVAAAEINVAALISSRGTLFWLSRGTRAAVNRDAAVRSCARNSERCTPLTIGPLSAPAGFAIDGTRLYVNEFERGVVTCELSDCATRAVLAPRITPPFAAEPVATDPRFVYFFDGPLKRLVK